MGCVNSVRPAKRHIARDGHEFAPHSYSSDRRDGRTTLGGHAVSRRGARDRINAPTRSPERGGSTESVLIYGANCRGDQAIARACDWSTLTRDPGTSNLQGGPSFRTPHRAKRENLAASTHRSYDSSPGVLAVGCPCVAHRRQSEEVITWADRSPSRPVVARLRPKGEPAETGSPFPWVALFVVRAGPAVVVAVRAVRAGGVRPDHAG